MSDPKREQLEELTLRGIVAYAVRCARRVQPLVEESGLSTCHTNAVIEANNLAADFVRGVSLNAGAAYAVEKVQDAIVT